MDYLQDIWAKALDVLEKELEVISFNTWIKPTTAVKIDGRDLILKAENEFSKEFLEGRYLNLIKNAIIQVSNTEYNIMIITNETLLAEQKAFLGSNGAADPVLAANLNPRYVFESFVVGNSNRMAHAASLAVAEAPARAYNPLFLYGNVGLGKTHLMHSIAHYILAKKPETKVLYVTSETFTNELINSISNNKNEEFRNKYRNIDVLLIDDIQFIAQKERTQEEFFHTFNALHGSSKQIILSSDRPPREIKTLEERLRSRFEGGLIADIQPPDIETRIAILRNKARSEGYVVSDNVLSFIATYIETNIRELEGALTRIVLYASLTNKDITVELAEEALKDIYGDGNQKQITTDFIMDIICNYYNITVADIKGNKKPKNIAYPRQIAMYLSRKLLDISLAKIGEDYGGRDHTTVLHACNKIEKDMDNDPDLSKSVMELEKRIKGI